MCPCCHTCSSDILTKSFNNNNELILVRRIIFIIIIIFNFTFRNRISHLRVLKVFPVVLDGPFYMNIVFTASNYDE